MSRRLGGALLSLALAGCAIGGRVHGGVLADRDGVEPFAGVTATFALVDGRSHVGLEPGGALTSRGTLSVTTDVRVAREVHPGYGWTASAGAAVSNHDTFGRVTGGGLLVQRWPDDLGPGVLAPTQMMMSAEAVVAVGGNHGVTDAHARAGFQIGLGFLHVLVWR